MKYIYELTHFYEDEDGYDIVTNIAIYSSRRKANKALERLKFHPKFVSHPNGFYIAKCRINQCGWSEGFVSFD